MLISSDAGSEGPVIVKAWKGKAGEGAVVARRGKQHFSSIAAFPSMQGSGDEAEADRDCPGHHWAGLDPSALLSTHTVLFLPTAAQKQAVNSWGGRGRNWI